MADARYDDPHFGTNGYQRPEQGLIKNRVAPNAFGICPLMTFVRTRPPSCRRWRGGTAVKRLPSSGREAGSSSG
jgi:hypothetical protein